ncbi:hypothetical protein FQN54_009848 [Arachnomyces sp. PD_36]|nr:hypothetical protein FQN54_009848 [Arachnomyces sp. PD_36]
MSSRLLTMKFMQRAAASATTTNNSSTTPPSSKRPPHSETDDITTTPPSQKRQKLSSSAQRHSEASSPIATPRSSDLEAIALAQAAEDRKRSRAVAKYAAEAGETQWVLDFGADGGASKQASSGTSGLGYPYIVSAHSIDSVDEQNQYGQDDDTVSGRQCYGNYKRKKRSQTNVQTEDDEENNAGDEIVNPREDNMANPAHVDAVMRRAQQNADRKSGKSKGPGKFGGNKEIDLRNLKSISGGGGAGGGGSGGGSGGGQTNGRRRGRDDRRR